MFNQFNRHVSNSWDNDNVSLEFLLYPQWDYHAMDDSLKVASGLENQTKQTKN